MLVNDGEVVVESVGGVMSGSGRGGTGTPCCTVGEVGVFTGWLVGPIGGGLEEYHGSLRC